MKTFLNSLGRNERARFPNRFAVVFDVWVDFLLVGPWPAGDGLLVEAHVIATNRCIPRFALLSAPLLPPYFTCSFPSHVRNIYSAGGHFFGTPERCTTL